MLVADSRADAEDALELVRGGAVDRQPPVVEIGDLHERVPCLRRCPREVLRSASASVTRRSSVSFSSRSRASLSRSARSATTRCVVSDTAQNIPATLPLSSRTGE